MGIPQGWHRRQALLIASQVPDRLEDARLIMQAMQELVDNFLDSGCRDAPPAEPRKVVSLISVQ